MVQTIDPELTDLFGPVISSYSRADAIADGTLVDMHEWASDTKGFIGGFKVPVAMTRAVWTRIEKFDKRSGQDERGRAHDVLFMSSLALRSALRRNQERALFKVLMSGRYAMFRIVLDGDGATIMEPTES